MHKFVLLGVVAAGALLGQKLEFEVARIKPADPITAQNAQALLSGTRRIGLNVTGQQVDIGYMSIVDLAAAAYEVKPLDITAPGELRQQRFDISALMPEGATREQLPQMLQAMLRDRFQMVARKEAKEQSIYALEVAKGGHKMKEAAPEEPKPVEVSEPAPAKPGERSLNIGGQQLRINQGGGGATITGAGQRMSVTPDGIHMEMDRVTMQQLAENLSTFVDLPVQDRTGLTGAFQLALDLTQADLMQVMSRVASATGASFPSGALGGAPAGGPAGLTAADPGGRIMASIQKLGLRLEKAKGPVTALVIESAEKLPSEN